MCKYSNETFKEKKNVIKYMRSWKHTFIKHWGELDIGFDSEKKNIKMYDFVFESRKVHFFKTLNAFWYDYLAGCPML